MKSPKIYFTDTGLAAFLLGIGTPEQAARDPLRGGLYENLVILEIMKDRLNKKIFISRKVKSRLGYNG